MKEFALLYRNIVFTKRMINSDRKFIEYKMTAHQTDARPVISGTNAQKAELLYKQQKIATSARSYIYIYLEKPKQFIAGVFGKSEKKIRPGERNE